MKEMKKEFLDMIELHKQEIESLKQHYTLLPLDSFYVGDIVKKFHEILHRLEHLLQKQEMHSLLKDFEPYKMTLELIKFNCTKIPLKKKIEDTKRILSTYSKNLDKIIQEIE